MQPKKHRRTDKFVTIFAGAVLLFVLLDNTAPKKIAGTTLAAIAASVVVPEKQIQIEQKRYGLPTRLIIPNIAVDAKLEYVGLTPDGIMGVPKEQSRAAWFNLGVRPGEIGSAVIAGHYGWKDGKVSVFDNLRALSTGDRVSVEDSTGRITTFVVREIKEYDPKADASAVFNSYDGIAHLNLITCEGVWDAVSKSYPKRLVVFADKIPTDYISIEQ
ncbi:MAG: class F sortase [bacterium]|nr:class F sortase [bacterium]